MTCVRRIKVLHGELTVQMDSFPARWEKFQREYEKLCRIVSFKASRNPDGQLFMRPIYKNIGRLFDGCFGAGSSIAVFGGTLVSPEQLNEFCGKFEPIYEGWLAEN